jgi:hypothetical protein
VRRIVGIALSAAVAGLALAAAPGGAVPPGGAAPNVAAVAGIVCPLGGASLTATIPCCGPPMAGAHTVACCGPAASYPCCPVPTASPTLCCPPNALCASPATIVAAPNPSLAGGAVKLSGTIPGAVGSAVALWQRLSGQASFTQVAGTTADSSGAYQLTMPGVTTNREWYVRSGSVQSGTIVQQVRPRVRVTVAFLPGRGAYVLRGSLTPSHAGEMLTLQQRIARRWRRIARHRLNRASRFAFVRRLAPPGSTLVLRIVFAGDARNIATRSDTLRVGSIPSSVP